MQSKKKKPQKQNNTIGNFEQVVNLAIEKAKTKPVLKKNKKN